MTTATLNPIEILRPGSFTSEEGDEIVITAADVQDIASGYDPERNPAPIVIGHPKMDAPAFGWIGSMRVTDAGVLEAIPSQVDPAFAEMVLRGRFKKVSGRFYGKDSPFNPTPGKIALRHVGALGAHPPAVKGLANMSVSFAEGSDAGLIGGEQDISAQSATESNPNPQPEQKEPEVATEKTDDIALAEQVAELKKHLAAKDAKIVADAAAAQKAASEAAHAANLSFTESAIASARLPAHAKDSFVFVLDQLSATKSDISFGEGEKAVRPAELLKAMISGAKPLIDFGEFVKPGDKPAGKMSATQIAAMARKYQDEQAKLGNMISVTEAVRMVENKEMGS